MSAARFIAATLVGLAAGSFVLGLCHGLFYRGRHVPHGRTHPAPSPETAPLAHDPKLCNEWNGYRVEPVTRREYTCPDWPHVIEHERPAERPLARDAGRIMGTVLSDLVAAAPSRTWPEHCPHCGDRFRTTADLAAHVRDTGDGRGRHRPNGACPVLWRKRGNDRPTWADPE